MKKWLIGIVLLIGVVIAAKQLSQNDYSSAKQLADAGNYQAFYAEIKEDVKKGDKEATDLLLTYLFEAISKGDIVETKYYLENNSNLVNREDERGTRALGVAIFYTKENKNEMLKLLLQFNPELNYRRTKPEDVTNLEEFFIFLPKVSHPLETLTLLYKHGMNLNNYGDFEKHIIGFPPLALSYHHNNFEIFNYVLQYANEINPIVKSKKNQLTLLEEIAFSYVSEIQKQGAKLEHPADEKLWAVIHSEKYRQLHQNNMQYITALLNKGLIDKVSENELKKLFVYYASTGEMDSTKAFIDHGMCQKSPNLCTQAIEAAHMNNFTEIEKIIGGK
jgi:hypothetical protein